MNILQNPWLPFKLIDGTEQVLPMSAICRNNVIDFALPRADFQGAAYQFAIGLLQTVFAPEDENEWIDCYEKPPSEQELQEAFKKVEHAFNVEGDGPLFMQDYDELATAKPTTVAGLLIEAPGANGLKLNTDHFIKRGIGEVMSLEMAVLALFTLQINAPSGGSGHRVGLRGGGPLTTLIMPSTAKSTLWHKLWLNIINLEHWRYPVPDFTDGSVFPWLAKTKTSEKKGSEIYQDDVHPLHMFWAMPRRIRLDVTSTEAVCKISGLFTQKTVSTYRTQNYGGNYSGTWSHPLTPYKWDPKKPDEEHLSAKGQPGGITYKIWELLSFTSNEEGQRCAAVVNHYYSISNMFEETHQQISQLWAFAYDMDNMKARCWYANNFPVFPVLPEQHDNVLRQIKQLQTLSNNALWHCRSQIKSAWFEVPSDVKGDTSFIDLTFWQRTESVFFTAVAQLVENTEQQIYTLQPEQAKAWLSSLRIICLDLFDEYALSELGNQKSMAKRIKARQQLAGWLFGGKDIKAFIANHNIEFNKELA
ncbi:type I-E CRISPR-associated protein Cse1/CasA [Pseudoalteromonas sp. KG3]|uniref:type I-E CRISPR-associated protein Cse1/CasA n=1 Tax=Pseudoalteromonas TaxID=53246 RepID=UPI00265A5D53|nr:type I-E CRISPR-associated protein Cse1/CasA [Pseudoalteromonas sp. KG3]WKD25975.1 type I-E CRISPR-associated protein Cse1/CasA [Pseudoalteromonas sp. KG3]